MAGALDDLIPIEDEGGRKLVPARELHKFLQNRKHFSDWFRHRCTKYRLEEGKDYIKVASPVGEAKHGGHNAIEYALTLDTAKELSMVEASDRGKEAREYFIRKEKLANVLQEGAFQMLENIQRRLDTLERTVRLQHPPAQLRLPEPTMYTVLGFARRMHYTVALADAIRIGKRAVELSAQRGLKVGQTPDARYGKVNTYHTQVLKEVFESEFPLL